MRDLVTPKQVARAIQVSESSVKRWCDKGVIPTRYTPGGHRRIPLSGFLEFLKTSKHELLEPEILGLPTATGRAIRGIEEGKEQLVSALINGEEDQCRRLVIDLFLAEHSLSSICDRVLAEAFTSIGDAWACGDAEVYQERRGCEITLRILHDLRNLIPPVAAEAPRALGAATEGDQYALATTMAELVLREAGWNASSLGDNLPFETLAAAVKQHRPKLFWLSCSHLEDEADFLYRYGEFYDEFGLDMAIVVGGRALTESMRQQMKYSAFCDNMQHLEAFALTIRGNS